MQDLKDLAFSSDIRSGTTGFDCSAVNVSRWLREEGTEAVGTFLLSIGRDSAFKAMEKAAVWLLTKAEADKREKEEAPARARRIAERQAQERRTGESSRLRKEELADMADRVSGKFFTGIP